MSSHLRHRGLFVGAFVALLIATAAPSAVSSPEHRCKLHGFSAVKFIYSVSGNPPHVTFVVRNALVICGGPDDEHWSPVGKRHAMGLAPGARIQLIPVNSTTPRPATLAQLKRLTTLGFHDKDFAWFGDAYGVQINADGQIQSLTELFHP